MNMTEAAFLFFAGALLAFWITFNATKDGTDNWWRDEVARRGFAAYYLDQSNNRQWNWKEESK